MAGGGDWDTTTTNWTADGGGRNDNLYLDGDDVTFDNAAGGVINLTADRAPGSTTVSAASGTYTFSGSNVTSGTLTKSGAGTLQLDNLYTGSGNFYINGGVLKLGASNLISDTAIVRSSGSAGTLDMDGNAETMRWGSPTAFAITNLGNLTITNTSTTDRSGSQPISGSGSLTFGPSHTTTILSGTHSYTGGTFIEDGRLSLYGAGSHQLPATGSVTVEAGATFDLSWHLNGSTKTIGALSGDGDVVTSVNQPTNTALFRIGNGGDSSTFGGVFSGLGSLEKLGAGTQTLDGDNTYTGTTTITGGTLIVNGTTSGQDDYTVKTGATLGGSGTINLAATKSVTVESGGTVAPGNSPGTLTINGDLTLLDGSFLQIEIGTISDLLEVNGQLTGATSVGGVTIDLTNLGAGAEPVAFLDWDSASGVELSDFQLLNPDAGELSIVGNQLLFTQAVPEPSSLLTLAALVCLGALRRRRRKA